MVNEDKAGDLMLWKFKKFDIISLSSCLPDYEVANHMPARGRSCVPKSELIRANIYLVLNTGASPVMRRRLEMVTQ